MIRVCGVCSLRVKFNIDLSFSEMIRLYWIKCIYTHREKKDMETFIKGILKMQYICGKIYLYMHQFLDLWNFIGEIKASVHFFYFRHQNKTFKKLLKMLFLLLKKLLLFSTFSNFSASRFPYFFLSWP